MEFDPLPPQRLAIEAPLGPVLVVAGPGAGKTFCLIARIHHLIDTLHMAPERICAVTFTNRAAEEIAVRLKHTLEDRADGITRGTIHALCLALLREHADAAGLRKGFGVADEPYQKVILGRLHVPLEQRGSLLNRFSRHRVQKHDFELTADDARLYREYAAWLAHRNMLDFDDLVSKAEELLRTRGDLADAIAARWDYLLVDEFQDVNAVQYDLLKRLAAPHGNFFAVGDDEQSIFTWTGADPYVLVRFARDYEIDRPIVLDRNCRSSRQIFETARRVLAQNPQLFEKQLSAEQESAYDVGAFAFRDEEEEASWLLDDILADRAASGLGWGDYAVLYRRHKLGEYLEGRLVRAGIPCRLARGRALVEDDVIKYVIAALRIVRDHGDPVALEAFARCVLSAHFLQEVEAAISASLPVPLSTTSASPPDPLSTRWRGGMQDDFLAAIRALARRRPAQDPDTKKLWRLVFQVENLRALPRSHRALAPLVDEILSQSVGPYRNALEERHDELTDPADSPEAVALAARLAAAIAAEQEIVIEPQGGLEIALRGMLIAAGVRRVSTSTTSRTSRTSITSPLTLFKALQNLHSLDNLDNLPRYVTFDLETTDGEVATCGVVEIGAARVVRGEIVDRFHTLVQPYQPISPRASAIHGYTDSDVRDARSFAQVWPEFRAFVGDDVLIAHNGQQFDIPVLRRLAAGQAGVDDLVFYDTLPLARSLSRDSAKLEDLALRFGIDAGRAHHALDDAVTLARVYRELERQRGIRARKAVLVSVLDYLGLALALEPRTEQGAESGERDLLFKLAKFYTLGRYSDALAFYEMERGRTASSAAPPVDEVIRRLGGRALMTRLRAEPDPAQRYPAAVARLRALMDEPLESLPPYPLATTGGGGTLNERIDRLLERVALSTSDGIQVSPDRVNLLTLHSTKGLEFPRVYIVGLEDYQIPGYRESTENRQAEIQEARRLVYVGMTRARERLVLTRVERRFGMEAGGSSFLEEMGLEVQGVGAE